MLPKLTVAATAETTTEKELQNINWADVNIPDDLRPNAAVGLPTQAQCAAAIAAIVLSYSASRQQNEKRSISGAQLVSRESPGTELGPEPISAGKADNDQVDKTVVNSLI